MMRSMVTIVRVISYFFTWGLCAVEVVQEAERVVWDLRVFRRVGYLGCRGVGGGHRIKYF
jgi:hypothetical protein